jgi:hypothetical protein
LSERLTTPHHKKKNTLLWNVTQDLGIGTLVNTVMNVQVLEGEGGVGFLDKLRDY